MKFCNTCKHWHSKNALKYGKCDHQDVRYLIAVQINAEKDLQTNSNEYTITFAPEFGCGFHEDK